MIQLKMIGHQDDFTLSDVLRLFFGPVARPEPDILTAGSWPFFLTSEIQVAEHKSGKPEQDTEPERSVSDSRFEVRVATRFWVNPEHYQNGQPPLQILDNYVRQADVRRELKRQLYQLLEKVTDTHFPWGSLTGVRPTQVVEQLMASEPVIERIRQDLIDRWRLQPAKADLAIRTSLSEQRVLSHLSPDETLIYAGIPFCPSRCSYCSFIAQDAHHRESWLAPYVDAMLEEARRVFSMLNIQSRTFYLGGGTPTSLPADLLYRLLSGLQAILPLGKDAEITVEAGRPDTINAEKLAILREFGATRICINPQTFNDQTLQRIGRQHTVEQTVQAMDLARQHGFDHINMDLIAGLPGESPADFDHSLDALLALHPESATVHTLAVKRSSRLSQEMDRAERDELAINRPDENRIWMIDRAQERLVAAGLYPYYLYRQKDAAGGLENVGYAQPGQECRYNVGMMSDRRSVIGLGSGSITKRVDGRKVSRVPNDKDIAHYISRLDELVDRKINLLQPAKD